MGGVCITEPGRHSTTRQAHTGYQMPIYTILGANPDVTEAIEAHR